MAEQVVTGSVNYVGSEKLTGLDTAKALASIPADPIAPTYAIITAETKGVRILGGGVNPTATTGTPIAAGASMQWDAELAGVRILEQEATAVVHVLYFRSGN